MKGLERRRGAHQEEGLRLKGLERRRVAHQEEREEEHEDAVPEVAEHDRKQEGEGHDGEHRGVDLCKGVGGWG